MPGYAIQCNNLHATNCLTAACDSSLSIFRRNLKLGGLSSDLDDGFGIQRLEAEEGHPTKRMSW